MMRHVLTLLLLLTATTTLYAQSGPPVQIHNLPAGAALNGTESIPMDQGICTGCTFQTTPKAIANYVLAQPFTINANNITMGTLPCAQMPSFSGAFSSNGCITSFSAQVPNVGLFGPASGSTSAAPTFRALVPADLPASITSNTSGTAAALAATPAQCPAGQVATGVTANGTANCSTVPAAALECGMVNQQTSSYTVAAGDNCNTIAIQDNYGSPTVSIPTTGIAAPFQFTIANQGSTMPITALATGGGQLNFNGGLVTSFTMLPATSCTFTFDGTNFETSSCGTALNPTGVANVLQYGAPGDTVLYESSTFTCTAGGSSVSFGKTIGGNFAQATIVMTGEGQIVATAPITVTSGGSGFVNGEVVTMVPSTGGADDGTHHLQLKVIWQVSGVVQGTSATNNAPGVAVLGVGGNITAWPTNGTFVESSSTGSGTGLTVNMAQSALPLATTIASSFTGGSTIPINGTCSTTLTNATEWVAWGHDDEAGIQAAIDSGAATVWFPPGHTYGIRSFVTLSNSTPQIVDLAGNTVVALSSMAEMFKSASNGSVFHKPFRGKIKPGILEGMGISALNILNGADLYDFDDVTLLDPGDPTATTANFEINAVGGGGSVFINNQMRFQVYNNPLMNPNYPTYCMWVANANATDNQFMPGEFWTGCQQAGVHDISYSTFYQGPIHVYNVTNGPSYDWQGAAYGDDLYADNPEGYYCGFNVPGYSRLTAWTVLISTYNQMAQDGVCTNGANIIVSGGLFLSPSGSTLVTAANGCINNNGGSGQTSTIFINNVNCSFTNPQTIVPLQFNTVNTLAASSTNYCPFGFAACATSTTAFMTNSRAGLIQNLRVVPEADIGSGNTAVATLISTSGTPVLTCTITGGSGAVPCTDSSTADAFAVNAGTGVAIKIVMSSGATAARFYGSADYITYH